MLADMSCLCRGCGGGEEERRECGGGIGVNRLGIKNDRLCWVDKAVGVGVEVNELK